jgi:hypothetical protein
VLYHFLPSAQTQPLALLRNVAVVTRSTAANGSHRLAPSLLRLVLALYLAKWLSFGLALLSLALLS